MDTDKDDVTLGLNDDSRQNRSEKKSRKAMCKLGMKPILFFISKPDVLKSTNSDTYVIFGEAKIEDLNSQLQTQAAQKFRMPDMGSVMIKPENATSGNALQGEEEEEVDETGVQPRDIELVMTQAGLSNSKAVNALKTPHSGDIVSAVMELTT